ncbi:pentatricopeptide repeat-containing protein At1g08070, chloroplastic-like [Magnolia sinica]|uniref:pentatricopeptide repeat-containing protein At1g08070, chloroplastic-like n=1 Tax=Magnolia sinica TaxID=86752 RepID=UPI0026595706|nr:pentatricopeptide repeat-containing protein At1g08070, chloroplastic-like [Magnolia sinica]
MPYISQPSVLSRQITSPFSKFKNPLPQTLSHLQSSKSMNEFKQIQAQAIRTGEIMNTFIASKMLEFCAVSAANMDYALRISDTVDRPNAYTWTTMIRGFVVARNPERAIEFFEQMRLIGVEPNRFTFLFVLKAFSLVPNSREGRIVHGKIFKNGLLSDEFLRNALIHVYFKCGEFESARHLFDEISTNNAVIWNTVIVGCFACGDIKNARKLFDEMPQRNVASWNAAISGYSRWGHVDVARSLFDEMPERDLLSWSAMIAGYSQSAWAMEAVVLFQEMLVAGVRPDSVTLVSVLQACSQIGALDIGQWLHAYVDRNKLRHDVVLGTSLVDMYAKCGCIDIALQVFRGMLRKNVLSWNAMLCGLAMHGHGDHVTELFTRMELAHVWPNDITFVAVLSACSHIGSVDEGRRQFIRMCKEFNIIPKIEHYGCMVDLLGRAGLIDEAKELIRSMPMEPNIVIWGALLSACRAHGDISAGEHVMKHLLKLAPGDGGCYVLLSNICATGNRWDLVSKMRKLMRDMGVERIPGCSSIEVNGVVHEFLVDDKAHPNWKETFEALDRLSSHLEDEGYVPNRSLISYDMDEKLA